jgi:hypothetical protein
MFIPKSHFIATVVNPRLCAESIALEICCVRVAFIVCKSTNGLGDKEMLVSF